MRAPTAEARRIVRAVRQAGGECELTRGNHLRVVGPDRRATVIGVHYGCPASFRNAMAKVKRHTGMALGLTPG